MAFDEASLSSQPCESPESSSGVSCCCHHKHTPRDEAFQKALQNRLNRMIGQLNGIKGMLDDNRYCGDVLTQVAAVQSALQSFATTVLQDHMQTCVVEEIQNGNAQIVDEVVDLMRKLR